MIVINSLNDQFWDKLSILAATILIAGIFAFMPVERASTVHTSLQAAERDNLVIHGASIVVADTQSMVLADNAGIGGTSDFEIVWRIADVDCGVTSFDGTIVTALADDGAFAGIDATLNHADVSSAEAILLQEVSAGVSSCDFIDGDFLTISTVGV